MASVPTGKIEQKVSQSQALLHERQHSLQRQNGNPAIFLDSANTAECSNFSKRSTSATVKRHIATKKQNAQPEPAAKLSQRHPRDHYPCGDPLAPHGTPAPNPLPRPAHGPASSAAPLAGAPCLRPSADFGRRRESQLQWCSFYSFFSKNGLPFAWCMILCSPFSHRGRKAMAWCIRAR